MLQPTGTNRFWRIKFPHRFAVFAAKKFYFRQNCSAPANGRFVPDGCNTTSRSLTAFKKIFTLYTWDFFKAARLTAERRGWSITENSKSLIPVILKDENYGVGITNYADTVVFDGNKSFVAIRFGGYPEKRLTKIENIAVWHAAFPHLSCTRFWNTVYSCKLVPHQTKKCGGTNFSTCCLEEFRFRCNRRTQ